MNDAYEGLTKEERRDCRAWMRWAKVNGKMPAAPGLAERIAAMNHTAPAADRALLVEALRRQGRGCDADLSVLHRD